MKCSICNTNLKGKYCENCGQKHSNKRLSLKTLLSDIVYNLTDIEKNVFLNIYQIIRYPKKVIMNYWSGFRSYYYKPGKMLFYFITIAGISSLFLEQTLLGLTFNLKGQISEPFAFAIVFFPTLSISSFLTYRRYKRNYIEHLVSTIYLVSTFGIVLLMFENLFMYLSITDQNNTSWTLVLIGLVLLWNSMLFTTPSKPLKIVLNSILEFIVLISILSLIAILLYLTGSLSLV